jgi:tetratricopeptide (TPR) repeat protein
VADDDAPTFVLKSLSRGDELADDGTLVTPQAAAASPADDTQTLPASIGRYRILRLLGEGGMGAVYEAEQEFPHRTVALKVIRAGYANREMLRRFENETQALGRLQHPGIAQIYEAGTAETPFGRQPYFAMELVQGQALLSYCDEHRLKVRQRLELMAKICDAVQHAHQRGLIHRDLKPANILVDESGQPRILDFGVARLTDSDAQATRQTDIGQLVGTLAYMSPEQVLGDPAEIDTRSDVYALGVILYELLAGKGPYVLGWQLHDVVRTIREEEPTTLSSVNRTYRGDIETIVGKALEKDKTRRYASAAELAADIRRYLRDEPITARPPSASYQLQKFARRNKALVMGVAAVFVVLVAGVVASTWEAVQARRAEAKAKQESAIAQAVNDFLQNDLLGQASAYNQSTRDPDIKVRTALDRAAERITGKFERQPEVEASIRDTIGMTYTDLGLYPEAAKQLEGALDLRRRVLGREHSDTLRSMNNLAKVYEHEGKYAQAEALNSQTMETRRRVLGPEHPDTLTSMSNLAVVYDDEGKYAQAEALDRQILETRRRVLGPEHLGTLWVLADLGRMYQRQGRYALAETYAAQALAGWRRALGAQALYTMAFEGDLALAYLSQGKFAQSEPLAREALEAEKKVQPDDWERYRAASLLGASLAGEKKYAEAEPLLLEGYHGMLARKDRTAVPDQYHLKLAQQWLLQLYQAWGKPVQAAEWQKN